MIQLIVIIFINSALMVISTPTSTILPTNDKLSNEALHSSDIIYDDIQSETEPKLDHNKNIYDTLRLGSYDNKVKSDNNRKEKFTKDILGELIITLDYFFEDNYKELEQYSKLYWNTYQLIKDQIEDMQITKYSMQRLLEKYDNINFNE